MKTKNNTKELFYKLSKNTLFVLCLFFIIFLVGCKRTTTKTENDEPFEAFGKSTESSTYSSGEYLKDSFYYKDAWFNEDPTKRNDALALISMQLVAASTLKGNNSNIYKFLSLLGFDTIGFNGYESSDPDDLAYTYATKKIGDTTLVAIVVQSYALDNATKVKGWKQNFHVNDLDSSGEHYAFKKAAEKVLDEIASLGGSKAKYWVMGQSRGGALANLIAAKLPKKLGSANNGVYAYTFESPATVDRSAISSDTSNYSYIHNYLAKDDIVTLIPMWNMVRYGNDYDLRTEETETNLLNELEKIGSGAKDIEFDYSSFDNESLVKDLVDYLEERVQTRSDYSKHYVDSYVDANETLKTVEYSYQDTMIHLMESIFSGEFSGISTDLLSENMVEFSNYVYILVDAIKLEKEGGSTTINSKYYAAAKGIRSVVQNIFPNSSISLTDNDFYVILKLVGPKVIDTTHEREGDDRYDVSAFIYPLLDIAMSVNKLVLSHHFDVIIARLKTLAPQPEIESINLSIDSPKAGDKNTIFVDRFKNEISKLNKPWINVLSASWNNSKESLDDNRLYYFDVKLEVIGHSVKETFGLIINDNKPVSLETEYKDGVCIVSLKWEFVIGNPSNVTITFDTGNDISAPSSISVLKGKSLRFVDKPYFEKNHVLDNESLLFDDWADDNGSKWSDITIDKDITLHANWIKVINLIEISFDIPSIGDDIPSVIIKEGASYIIEECNIFNEQYTEVESIDKAGVYNMSVFIIATDGSVFAEAIDEYEEIIFDGIVKVNGDEWDDYVYEYYEEPILLAIFIEFTVE